MTDSNPTQTDVDTAFNDLRTVVPTGRMKEVEDDIKARANNPLDAQIRWANRVRDTFEDAEVAAKYAPETVVVNGKKVASTNPWSAASWNATEQSRLYRTLGEAKALQLAKAAGCKIGDTKPNPHFN